MGPASDFDLPFLRKLIASKPSKDPLKVLVCDDERHIVRLIQVNLERQGYRVVTAFDGEACLGKVEAERPDVCILDAAMPGMDGFEVIKRIRQNPETKRLPVIMLGAGGKNPEVFDGDDEGADLYLTKPFNPKDL